MKKWTYLVATLFFGATVAFTSCVNTDEPEGIKEMRGAKAELLRAKALVEQAKATSEAAQATLTQAQAEVQKAIAEVQKAQAEAQRAQTQIEKDKAAANLKSLQAKAEAEIAAYEAQAAAQQLAYETTMKQLEALALTLTPVEQAAIQSWKDFADKANTKLFQCEAALNQAQKDYNSAVVSTDYYSVGQAESEVAVKQVAADAKAAVLANTQNTLAYAQEYLPAEWDDAVAALNDTIKAYEVALAQAKLDAKEAYLSDEFQAYEQAVAAAIEAKGENEVTAGHVDGDQYYETTEGAPKQWTGARAAYYVAQEEFNKVAQENIALKGYSFDVNPAIATFMVKAGKKDMTHFHFKDGLWTLAGYVNDETELAKNPAYSPEKPDYMFQMVQKLNAYRNDVAEFTADPNGQEWLKLELPAKKEASLKADTAYMDSVALWQIQADIVAKGDYSGVAIADSAKALKELIDGQNAAYTAYAAGVAAFDSMVYVVEKAAKAAYNAGVEKVMAEDTAYWLKDRFLRDAYNALPTNKDADDWKLGKIFYTQENWAADKFPEGGTGKDTVTMKIILGINHEVDPVKMPTTVDAVKAKVEKEYSEVFTADQKKLLMTSTLSYQGDANIGVSDFSVGNWNTAGSKAVTDALEEKESDLAKAFAETEKKWKLISSDADDDSLLKAYEDYDGNVIQNEFKKFSTALEETYGLNTVDTLSDDSKFFDNLVGYKQSVGATGDNSYKYVKDVQGNDSVVDVPGVQRYRILEAVNKSISDEAFATMTKIEKINQTQAKSLLTTYSHAAFGKKYDWGSEPRLIISDIEDKLLADCKAEKISDKEAANGQDFDGTLQAFKVKYGAFGAKYWNNYWFEVYSNYQNVDELVKVAVDSLDAQLGRMQAAVEAAKTACAEPLAALEAAKADYEAAGAAIEAAKKERNAQMTAIQAPAKNIEEVIIPELNYLKSNLENQIKAIASGQTTVAAYIASLESAVATANKEYEAALAEVEEAQKVVELVKAGTYSYEYDVQKAESALERAQANYDIAAAEYQAALAKLAEVLATLVGE